MPTLKERLEAERHEAVLERDELTEQIKILDWFIRHIGSLPNDRILEALNGGEKKPVKRKQQRQKRTVMPPAERRAQILDLLNGKDPQTTEEIGRATGLTTSGVRDHLNRLVLEGVVRRGPDRVNATGRNSATYERVPMTVTQELSGTPGHTYR